MKQDIYLHYAHCTKFTPGQLDRHPFSAYEMREIPAELTSVWSEEDGNEWCIKVGETVVAVDANLHNAIAWAEYTFMENTRKALSKNVVLSLK